MGEDSAPPAPPRLLIVLEDLDDSPAIRQLLLFLRWGQASGQLPRPHLLSQFGGDQEEALSSLVHLELVSEDRGHTLSHALQAARLRTAARVVRARQLRRQLGREDQVVYVPDIGGARLLAWLDNPRVRVVGHLDVDGHRLEDLDEARRGPLVNRVDHWLVATLELAQQLDVGPGRTGPEDVTVVEDLLPGLDTVSDRSLSRSPDAREWQRYQRGLLTQAGVPTEARVVCSAGGFDWWTHPDAFVQLCWELRQRPAGADLHFAWLAGASTDHDLWPLRHDIANAGLTGCVHVISLPEDPRSLANAIATADIYVASRRGRAPDAVSGIARQLADRTLTPSADLSAGRIDRLADEVLDLLARPEGPPRTYGWDPVVGGPDRLRAFRRTPANPLSRALDATR